MVANFHLHYLGHRIKYGTFEVGNTTQQLFPATRPCCSLSLLYSFFFVKVNNKSELDNNLNNFLRLIKLEAHFKDSINNDTDDKNRMFKENKNKDWTPSENHHTIDTHIGKRSNLKQVHPNFNKG